MRFFTMFTCQLRRVERREWLLVFPKEVFLPVLEQMRAIAAVRYLRFWTSSNDSFHPFRVVRWGLKV